MLYLICLIRFQIVYSDQLLFMAKKKNSWLARELTYLFLAPLLVLTGILLFGVLFETWYKDPIIILKISGIAYAGLLFLRLFFWIYRQFSR